MSDLDIYVRERHNISEDEDTVIWCMKNGLDYSTELKKVYFEKEK